MSEDQKAEHGRNSVLFELQKKKRELEEAKRKKKELQEELESFPQREAELLKKIEEVRNLRLTPRMVFKSEEVDRLVEKVEKTQREVLQKQAQVEKLKEKAAQMTERKQELQREVDRYSVYKDFLDKAVKFTQFEDTNAMVNHFEKLLYFRQRLYEKETKMQEKQSQQRKTLQELEERRQFLLMQHNNQMSELQAELDRTRFEVNTWESKWNHIQETAAKKTLELSRVRMATLNMYEKTGGRVGGADGVDMQDTEKQLDEIKMFIVKHKEILKEYQNILRKDEENKQERTRKPVREKGKEK
ncbi:coiled-coil domain-containing protein 42 homolog [Acanthochromis polyacanthus]|uniref:coiled-coil domain-containing protein 42 homolog n=1 Tax=Acanthochromis polyacanthus TaxID=80966 RepID=UPI0022347366|nr:coiled-coil domain-containing protein 42 homolog [Acanthochromis polyacanthus]